MVSFGIPLYFICTHAQLNHLAMKVIVTKYHWIQYAWDQRTSL